MFECLATFQQTLLIGIPEDYVVRYVIGLTKLPVRFPIAKIALKLTQLPSAIKQIDFTVIVKQQRSIMMMRRTRNQSPLTCRIFSRINVTAIRLIIR